MPRWALPDYVEDILPPEAMRVEFARRLLIDTCSARGYALVQPPLIEYTDSLTAGAGELDDHIFKVVDQLSGRLLGVRADMTPQAARIDAHLFADHPVNRLCYAGSVLHTQPTALNATREVVQGGAELYGLAGGEADREILSLMLDVLNGLKVPSLHLDLGHAQIFPALADAAGLDTPARKLALAALQRKEAVALRAVTTDAGLHALLKLYGDTEDVLARARASLPATPVIGNALTQLADLSAHVAQGGGKVTIDLADVPNYNYHSGPVFAVFAPGEPVAIARGGRYDNVGRAFGAPKPRPATGFSIDLRLAAAYATSL
jgi:ATP phosphoribosyltransferase regulatory subunit